MQRPHYTDDRIKQLADYYHLAMLHGHESLADYIADEARTRESTTPTWHIALFVYADLAEYLTK